MPEKSLTEQVEFVGGEADGDRVTMNVPVGDRIDVQFAHVESKSVDRKILVYERTDRKTQDGCVIYTFLRCYIGRIR